MGVQEWVFNIALKKGVKTLASVVVAWVTSVAITSILQGYGINVQVDKATLEAGMTALLTGGIEMLRNFLKTKYGIKFL